MIYVCGLLLTEAQFLELCSIPELSPWRFKRFSKQGLEDLQRPKHLYVVQLET